MIFYPVIILMKSNESFLIRVNMYLNHIRNWSFKMNSPNF